MNKELKKILQSKYPTIFDSNGGFIASECAKITEIVISHSEIKTIDGLEIFINLKNLYCDNSEITALDVQGCANLQILDCCNNALTSLNVQGCTKLQGLYCKNNQIAYLNVQGLTNLQTLYCHNNNLTALNVQGLANLKNLVCENNQIASLDVQGLTNLQSLYCEKNQIASLNVQGLTSMQTLRCEKSTKLDVKFIFNTANYCAFQFSENEIRCGCFKGTKEEFIEAVLRKYNRYCAYYKWAIAL